MAYGIQHPSRQGRKSLGRQSDFACVFLQINRAGIFHLVYRVGKYLGTDVMMLFNHLDDIKAGVRLECIQGSLNDIQGSIQ
jgi:hypothetical protein